MDNDKMLPAVKRLYEAANNFYLYITNERSFVARYTVSQNLYSALNAFDANRTEIIQALTPKAEQQPHAQEWRDIKTAPLDGHFQAWCRWLMKPINPNSRAGAYWTDWMARHTWRDHHGRLQGAGDAVYYVASVEATHWQPSLPAPEKKASQSEMTPPAQGVTEDELVRILEDNANYWILGKPRDRGPNSLAQHLAKALLKSGAVREG